MSADARLIAAVEAALRRRFGASSAVVRCADYRGVWSAIGHVTRDDGRLTFQPTTKHTRKRDAVRSVATVAGLTDADLDGYEVAP